MKSWFSCIVCDYKSTADPESKAYSSINSKTRRLVEKFMEFFFSLLLFSCAIIAHYNNTFEFVFNTYIIVHITIAILIMNRCERRGKLQIQNLDLDSNELLIIKIMWWHKIDEILFVNWRIFNVNVFYCLPALCTRRTKIIQMCFAYLFYFSFHSLYDLTFFE